MRTEATTASLPAVLTEVTDVMKMVLSPDDSLANVCRAFRETFEIGARVSVSGYECYGTVQYYGAHHESEKGIRVLVELDEPIGKNNGTIGGFTYATLRKDSGVLVRPDKVTAIRKVATFRKGKDGFGIKFAGAKAAPDTGVFISGFAPGGAGDGNIVSGTVIGWQIMRINDSDLQAATMNDLRQVLENVARAGATSMDVELQVNQELFGKFKRQKASSVKSKRRAQKNTAEVQQPAHAVSKRQVTKVVIARGKNGFGLVFGGANSEAEAAAHGFGIVIVGIKAGGSASKLEELINVGSQVLTMNGTDISTAFVPRLKQVLMSITDDTLELDMCRNEVLRNAYAAGTQVVTKVAKGRGGFGLIFGGAKNESEGVGVLLKAIKPEANHVGGAFHNPDIWKHVGWQVTSMHGQDLTNKSCSDLPTLMRGIGDELNLILVQNEQLRQKFLPAYGSGEAFEVVLRPGAQGYGVNFGGAKSAAGQALKGVFISKVKPGTPAAGHGSGLLGQQILVANGVNMLGVGSLEKLHSEVLLGAPSELRLRLVRNQTLVDTYSGANVTIPKFIVLSRAATHDPFGIEVSGPHNQTEGRSHGFGIYLSGIQQGSIAAASPDLTLGLQIISVNGAGTYDSTVPEFWAALQKAELHVRLEVVSNDELHAAYSAGSAKLARSREKMDPPAGSLATKLVRASVTRGPKGFGLKFGGPKDAEEAAKFGAGIFVSACAPGGAAESNDAIKVGMQVLTINGSDVSGANSQDLAHVLKTVGSQLELELISNDKLQKTYSSPTRATAGAISAAPAASTLSVSKVTLHKGPGGFGLRFGGAKSDAEGEKFGFGIFISGTKPGGVAEANASIVVGMQVMSINGQNLSDKTTESMMPAMRAVDQLMELELVENHKLFQTYAASKTSNIQRGRNVRSSMIQPAPRQNPSTAPATVTPLLQTENLNENLQKAVIQRDQSGFGVLFGGAKTEEQARVKGRGIFVSGTKPGSPASANRVIRAGLQILSVNGIDLSNAIVPDLAAKLKNVGSSMEIGLLPNPSLYASYRHTRGDTAAKFEVTIKKAADGYGLMFAGAKNADEAKILGTGIFISGKKPNGAASAIESIKPGLKILAVNGIETTSRLLPDLPGLLKSTAGEYGNKLVLTLIDTPAAWEAYNTTKSRKSKP